MGLDKFKSQSSYSIGSVSSRMKAKNMEVDEKDWKHLFECHPGIAGYLCERGERERNKCILEIIDKAIEDKHGDVQSLKEERQFIIETHFQD